MVPHKSSSARQMASVLVGIIVGFGMGMSFSHVHKQESQCLVNKPNVNEIRSAANKVDIPTKRLKCPDVTCPKCEALSSVKDSKDTKVSSGTTVNNLAGFYTHEFDLKSHRQQQDLLPLLEDDFPTIGGEGVNKATVFGETPGIADGDFSSCQYLDVLFQHSKQNRCLFLVDQPKNWHNFDHKEHGEGFTASSALSFKMNTTTQRVDKFRLQRVKWYTNIAKVRDSQLMPFMSHKDDAVHALKEYIGEGKSGSWPNEIYEPILVMCANEGHLPLLFNFFCSLKNNGIKEPKYIVFTTTEKLEKKLRNLGIKAFTHKALGAYPAKASSNYGDVNFSRMMMLKQFSVYLTMLCGYDILFQDVDLTWLRDPMPALVANAPFYNLQYMDDGSRRRINAPYFLNSGFFFLRNDFDSFKFWDQVTLSVFADAGNQRIVEEIMELHTRRRGLRVKPLSSSKAVNGMFLTEKMSKSNLNQLLKNADVLHFCWTLNINVKYDKMVTAQSDFISKECYMDIEKCNLGEGPGWHENVCLTRNNKQAN